MLAKYKSLVVATRYADGERYRTSDFTEDEFPPNGELTDEMSADSTHSRTYGFDKMERPIYVAYSDDVNGHHWEGFYYYKNSQVEYVEFCMETGVPSIVSMLTLHKKNRKALYMDLRLDNGGTFVKDGDIKALIQQTKKDNAAISCHIEHYIYQKDRLVRAQFMTKAPGQKRYISEKTYIYDDEGRLDKIVESSENENQPKASSVTEAVDPEQMIDTLARQMADAIVETLLKKHFDQTLFLLVMNYRVQGFYMPFLYPMSVADKEAVLAKYGQDTDFEVMFLPNSSEMITMKNEKLNESLKKMEQLIEQGADDELGIKMLRKAALLLTKGRLNGKIAVSDDFVAFPIDWEMEGDKFEEILRECGQTKKTIREWRQKGWLPKTIE